MPFKLRKSKRRRQHVSREAVERWQDVGPDAIQVAAGGVGIIEDEALADALSLPPLIYLPDIDQLVEALEQEGGKCP